MRKQRPVLKYETDPTRLGRGIDAGRCESFAADQNLALLHAQKPCGEVQQG